MHAVFQAPAADQHAQHHHQGHEGGLEHRVGGDGAELRAHAGGVQAHKVALEHLDEVQDEPAGDGGVEHHEQVVARHAEPAVPVPLGALWLQLLEGAQDALLAGPAHGELHDHDGQAHDDQEKQVHQHQGSAAVLAHDVGETPHIAQADGAAGRDQDEAQPGRKFFSLQNSVPPLSQINGMSPRHETTGRRARRRGSSPHPASSTARPLSQGPQPSARSLAMAALAAFCSASFLLRPSPAPMGFPSRSTSTEKTLAWSGPLSPMRR